MLNSPDARRRGLIFFWVLCSLLGNSDIAIGQADSTEVLGATLRGWEDNARLTILDRGGSFHGRTSDRGILQRFTEQLEDEYSLDLISFGFSLSEDYEWYRRREGFRWSGGSINHRFLVQDAEAAGNFALGEAWNFGVLFNLQNTLQADRQAVRVGFGHSWAGGRANAFVISLLTADKPEIDLEVGFKWKAQPGELTVAFGALDLFSDLIYQDLGVTAAQAQEVLDYTAHPYTLRVALELPFARHLRTEVFGLVMSPTEVTVVQQSGDPDGFEQEERYAYAGGLLEWSGSPASAFGLLGTWVRARLGRTPVEGGDPVHAFDLTEENTQLRAYGIQRFGRFLAEAWIAHIWRLEDRLRPDTTVAASIDYEDRTWAGRVTMTYRARSGFRAEMGVDFVERDVVGLDRLPGQFLGRNHSRLRLDVGWRFGRNALFVVGTNLDLDGDRGTATGAFDGAHGRFQVYW